MFAFCDRVKEIVVLRNRLTSSLRHLATKMLSQLYNNYTSFLPSFLPSYEARSINVNSLFHAAIKNTIKTLQYLRTSLSLSLSFIFQQHLVRENNVTNQHNVTRATIFPSLKIYMYIRSILDTGSSRGVVVNVLAYNIIVSEFKLVLYSYIHFQTLESYEPLCPASYGLNSITAVLPQH